MSVDCCAVRYTMYASQGSSTRDPTDRGHRASRHSRADGATAELSPSSLGTRVDSGDTRRQTHTHTEHRDRCALRITSRRQQEHHTDTQRMVYLHADTAHSGPTTSHHSMSGSENERICTVRDPPPAIPPTPHPQSTPIVL